MLGPADKKSKTNKKHEKEYFSCAFPFQKGPQKPAQFALARIWS